MASLTVEETRHKFTGRCSICDRDDLVYVCTFGDVEACAMCLTKLEKAFVNEVIRMRDEARLEKIAGCCEDRHSNARAAAKAFMERTKLGLS